MFSRLQTLIICLSALWKCSQTQSNMCLNNISSKVQSALGVVIPSEVLCLQYEIYTGQKIKYELFYWKEETIECNCVPVYLMTQNSIYIL